MILNPILAQGQQTDAVVSAVLSIIAVLVIVAIKRTAFKRTPVRKTPAGVKAAPFIYPTHPVVEPPAGAYYEAPGTPIDSVRQLLGRVPRMFDPRLMPYLTVVPPKWLEANLGDEQWLNIRHQERLRRDAPVVWGVIVQANNNLFKRINAESGASVIYSPDPWFDRNRNALRQIAQQCFALKATDPADPESAAFARMLTNELTRGMRMKVPSIFTGQLRVYHSSMLMPRKHLPKGFLSGNFFPLWMDPQNTGAVVMVPAAYWPASLTMEWDRE